MTILTRKAGTHKYWSSITIFLTELIPKNFVGENNAFPAIFFPETTPFCLKTLKIAKQ